MKMDKFIKILLGLIAMLLLVNLISGFMASQPARAEQHIQEMGRYEISYNEGVGRYQISSWAAETGNAGYHHSGYFVLDTVTGEVVDQKMQVHGPEE